MKPISSGRKIQISKPFDFSCLRDSYKNQLEEIDQFIKRASTQDIHLINEMSAHIFAQKGKRLRPLLLLICAQNSQRASDQGQKISLAAALEMLHTASLLHDDVIDESLQRRGLKTVNSQWNNKLAILMGDYLFSKSFEVVISSDYPQTLDVLSKATEKITTGEIKQLSLLGDLSLSLEEYFKINESKTASLFQAACEIGCLISEATPQDRDIIVQVGAIVGQIFQIKDDLIDYGFEAKNIGKNFGDDFYEGKITLPVILSYEDGSAQVRNFWQTVFKKEIRTEEDYKITLGVLKDSKVDKRISQAISGFCQNGKKLLNDLSSNSGQIKTELSTFIDCLSS
ncbi:MAG: hypothetical protein CMM87_03475 [Rickettsiales bacterium]|nr:hypothetical protein [Rickettsiales bacterium]|tara:strand:- start:14342 stop:15364 length:1023 start_codon:yes stop_codon:yes gene_type:complete